MQIIRDCLCCGNIWALKKLICLQPLGNNLLKVLLNNVIIMKRFGRDIKLIQIITLPFSNKLKS